MAAKTTSRKYWLLKTEPESYSLDDLARDKRTAWDGVRNYQARNYMRDDMQVGDLALIYHSSADPPGVAGVAKIVRAGQPDLTSLDPQDHHHDPRATREDPIWTMVTVAFVEKFKRFVALEELRSRPDLAGLLVVKRGMRLSVQPVEERHFEVIRSLGKKARPGE